MSWKSFAAQERRLRGIESERGRIESRQQMIDRLDVKSHIAEVYHALHDDIESGGHQFINLPGGRGSGQGALPRRLCS